MPQTRLPVRASQGTHTAQLAMNYKSRFKLKRKPARGREAGEGSRVDRHTQENPSVA